MDDPGHGVFEHVQQDGSWTAMPVASRLSSEQAAASEREYIAHREAVVRMLRREFPRMQNELDELYQQAWIEFLELRATGAPIDNPRALLQKIAWRAARARVRKKKPDLVEPGDETLASAADSAPLPDEAAQVHIDAEALRAVVESLDERQAAAIKLRFDCGMSSKEIQRALDVTPKRLEKIITGAYAQLSQQLALDNGGDSPWLRRQRSLLLACEIGLASARQRRRAQRLVEADPTCRAMLAEMRRMLHDVAAVIPAPVVAAPERTEAAAHSMLHRLADWFDGTRQVRYEAAQRLMPASSSVEQAGGAAGAALGFGAAAKAVAVCIAAGGTAALCIEGVERLWTDRPAPVQARPVPAQARPVPERIAGPAGTARQATSRSAPVKRVTVTAKRSTQSSAAPVSSPKYTAAPSPAPEGSTEFGPGGLGSSPAPSAPAVAPADGGGEFTP